MINVIVARLRKIDWGNQFLGRAIKILG